MGKIIHGMSFTKIYKTWASMKNRCYNPKHKGYKYYGGSGITVCKEWKNDFLAFCKYILEHLGEKPPGMTLDRFPKKDGNYEPGNVRWATRKQQVDNRRKQHNVADLTRQRFGKWTVLSRSASRNRKVYWLCRCECGNEKEVIGSSLRRKKSSQCQNCANKIGGYMRHNPIAPS